MTSRARSKLHAVWIAALTLGSSARAWSNERPVYVVTEQRVHVISEHELPLLRAHPCKPKGSLSFYHPPPGVVEHCHGRLFVNGKVTHLASDDAGTAWEQTTGAVTAGYSLWMYEPRLVRMLLEGEYGGGAGADGAFAYEVLIGGAFAVPGPALRFGTNVVLRGSPQFWHARWEAPAFDAAWVFADGTLAAELGVRGSAVLAGLFKLHDSRENLAVAPLFGPYFLLSHHGERLRTMLWARLSRIEQDPPFQELDARVCSGTGLFMICTRAEQRWMAREQTWWSVTEASGRETTLSLSAAFTAP